VFNNNNANATLNASHSHTPGNMSQRVSRPHSVAGSTHNSVIGSNTPRNLGDLEPTASTQVIEIHEIQQPTLAPPALALPTENLQLNVNNIPLQNPEDDDSGALM
jgi:hypothetical protein